MREWLKRANNKTVIKDTCCFIPIYTTDLLLFIGILVTRQIYFFPQERADYMTKGVAIMGRQTMRNTLKCKTSKFLAATSLYS